VPLGELHGVAGREALESLGAQVRTGSRVRGLQQSSQGWSVDTDEGVIAAKAVVLAVPHDAVADLAPADAGLDPAGLRALGSSPIVNVHVFYDRFVMAEPFAAAINSPVQWVFDRTAAAGVQRGQYLAISLSAAQEWQERKAAEIEKIFVAELARLLPLADPGHVERVLVTREPHATFAQLPGQLAHRPANETALPGLVVAGAWTRTGWPATMESAVRSGLAAARALSAA